MRWYVSITFCPYTSLPVNRSSSPASIGAAVPPSTTTGAVSTLISSNSPARRKPFSVSAPHTTISDCTPCPCSQPAICPGTVSPLSKQRPSKHGCSRSITMRLGSLPAHRRTLSFGLSLSAVTRPTSIASYSLLSLCTSICVYGVDMRSGLLQSSRKPFAV